MREGERCQRKGEGERGREDGGRGERKGREKKEGEREGRGRKGGRGGGKSKGEGGRGGREGGKGRGGREGVREGRERKRGRGGREGGEGRRRRRGVREGKEEEREAGGRGGREGNLAFVSTGSWYATCDAHTHTHSDINSVWCVREFVAVVVIATECQVNPSHESQRLVDDHNLLVVSPFVHASMDVLGMTKHLHEGKGGTSDQRVN